MFNEKFKLYLNYFPNSSLKFLSEYFLYILLLVFQPVNYSGSSKKHWVISTQIHKNSNTVQIYLRLCHLVRNEVYV